MATLLEISREMAALAQAGLTFARDPFDLERYHRFHALATEVLRASAVDFAWPAELGYPTPKVDVRSVVFRERQVLLVREASSGLWTAPGGWADVNLSPAQNAEKECLEESGYLVRARVITSIMDRDQAHYPRHPHSIYKIYLLCDLLGGSPKTSIESTEVGFFPLEALPPLDPHRVLESELRRAASFLDRDLPAAFN